MDEDDLTYDRALAQTELDEDNEAGHLTFAAGTAGLSVGGLFSKAFSSRAAGVLGIAISAFGELSTLDGNMRQQQIDAINAQLALVAAEKNGQCH